MLWTIFVVLLILWLLGFSLHYRRRSDSPAPGDRVGGHRIPGAHAAGLCALARRSKDAGVRRSAGGGLNPLTHADPGRTLDPWPVRSG